MSQSYITVGALAQQDKFEVPIQEPDYVTVMREAALKRFHELHWESDPNMLTFLKPKILQSYELFYPPHPLVGTIERVRPDPLEKLAVGLASPTQVGLSFPPDVDDSLPQAVTLAGLDKDTLAEDEVGRLFTRLTGLEVTDKLGALTLGTFGWGSLLRVRSGTVVGSPIKLTYQGSVGGKTSQTGLHLIHVGDNAELTLDLTYDSGQSEFEFSSTVILVGQNSHVNVLVVDDGTPERRPNRFMFVDFGRDSTVNYTQLQTEGLYVRQRTEFHLRGEGGDLVEVVALQGQDSQTYDFYSAVHHDTPRCTSNTIARGVNDDESLTVFKGVVNIALNAGNINTDMSLSGLLLSRKSRFHTIPAMEVLNNDVIATHGAAVSKVDPDQIFYMQSRGINREDAEHMVASGYFEPAISKIRNPYLQGRARGIITKAVDDHFGSHLEV